MKRRTEKTDPLYKYKVYYFVGDYWSGKGEQRKSTIITAFSESEAEKIFKTAYPKCNFGWIDEIGEVK